MQHLKDIVNSREQYPSDMVQESQVPYGEPIVAIGCRNFVVVLSWIGRCVAYDLMWKY